MLNGPTRAAIMYKALATISSAPPAIAVVAAGALIRSVRPVATAMSPNNVIEVSRAAISGHIPAALLVRARERKKIPTATPESIASHSPGGRPRPRASISVRIGRRRLLADQRDRDQGECDSRDGEQPQTFAQRESEEHRNHRGAHRGDRGDHCHRADGKRAVEQRDADAAAQAGANSPEPVARRNRGGRQKWQHRQEQHEADELRHDDCGDRVGAARGQSAEEIRGAVENGGAQREQFNHARCDCSGDL